MIPNYSQFNNQYYKQEDGLAMGVPTSAIPAEILIQYLEHTSIINILKISLPILRMPWQTSIPYTLIFSSPLKKKHIN
jgi:hypothetical protein